MSRSSISPYGWKAFALAAGAAAAAAVGFMAIMGIQLGGERFVTTVDDIGEAIAALIAAASCAFAASRSVGRIQLGWALMAASAAAWSLGEAVWSVYEVGLGVAVPSPSAADAGFLAALPLAIAGAISFWNPVPGASDRWRVWLDGLIVAVSLTFTAWALGLKEVFLSSGSSLAERANELVYPISEILIGTVLILVINRGVRSHQGALLLLLGGVAANSIAYGAFAYLTATHANGAIVNVTDTGWVVGYLMIALAAFWPGGSRNEAAEGVPVDIWHLALPWMAILVAAGSAVVVVLQGQGNDEVLTLLAATLAALLAVSQVLAHKDSLSMLIKSRLSEATLAEVIAHAPAAVVRIGTDQRIIEANPRFGTLLAATTSQAGVPLTQYFSQVEAARMGDLLRSLASGSHEAVESVSEARRADATSVWLHWSATVVPKPSGTSDYFIAMFEDTTARHEAEESAKASLAVLERLNDVKSEFLRSVSHEFKTALNGIQGFSEFMRDTDDLDVSEVRSFASDIYDNANRLDRLVNEMIDLERVGAGRASLVVEPVDLNAIIRREAGEMKAGMDGTVLTANLDLSLPPVAGDAAKLSEVVRTLLHNAVKYSPDGGAIVISSRMRGGQVEVSVRDQGVGVRADFDNRLFGSEDLYASNPIRKVVGTEMGLAIARQIVEMHGGRIWVERLDGTGSEVHFTVPLASSAQTHQLETAKAVGGKVA